MENKKPVPYRDGRQPAVPPTLAGLAGSLTTDSVWFKPLSAPPLTLGLRPGLLCPCLQGAFPPGAQEGTWAGNLSGIGSQSVPHPPCRRPSSLLFSVHALSVSFFSLLWIKNHNCQGPLLETKGQPRALILTTCPGHPPDVICGLISRRTEKSTAFPPGTAVQAHPSQKDLL